MKKRFLFLMLNIFLIAGSLSVLSGCSEILELFKTEAISSRTTTKDTTKTVAKESGGISQTQSQTSSSNQTTSKRSTTRSNDTSKSTSITTTQKPTDSFDNGKRSTTTTYIKRTTTKSTTKKTLSYTTEYSTCSHHEVINDEIKYPTFSFYGNDGYLYCDKCGKILDVNYTNPFGTILFSDYIYKNSKDSSEHKYTIFVDDVDARNSEATSYKFILIDLEKDKDGKYILNDYSGTLTNDGDNVYYSTYSNGTKERDYFIFEESKFTIINNTNLSKKEINYNETKTYIPRKGNTDYGYNFFLNFENGVELQRLFYDFYEYSEGMYNSLTDVAKLNNVYPIALIDARKYNLSYNEISAVWTMFYNTSPTYFFLENSFTVYNNSIPCLLTNTEYASKTRRDTINNLLEEATDDFLNLICKNDTIPNIIKLAHDYISENMDYAWKNSAKTIPQSELWAHNIVGFLEKGEGVCECYAKMFMYFTNYVGLDTIIVSGKASGEGHAWNFTRVGDTWYGVDVTWDDQETGIIYEYLLCDYDTIYSGRSVYLYDVLAMNYQYKLPEISRERYEFDD